MASALLQKPPTLYKRAPIEYIPAEIKIEILCQLPDLLSLRDLVKASPDFHSVYRFDRRRILSRLLARTTPLPILVEVASLPALRRTDDYDSSKLEEGVGRLGFAKDFLSIYDELLRTSQGPDPDSRDTKKNVGADVDAEEKEEVAKRNINGVNFTYSRDNGISAQFSALSVNELLLVVRQHFIVHSISQDFTLSCLRLNPFTGKRYRDNADDPGFGNGGGSGDGILPLSGTETFRIHRALYRLEMLGLIYTLWEVRDPNYYITFLKSLPPWEMEEIHCVRNYMYQVYLTSSLEMNIPSNYNVVEDRGRAMNRGHRNNARSRRRGRAGGIGIARAGSDDDVDFDLAVDDQRELYLSLGLEFLWRWFHVSDQDESRPVTTANTNTNVSKSLVGLSQQPMINPKICVTEGNSTSASFFLTRALNPSATGFFRPIVKASETFTSDADWPRPNLGWEWLHHKNSKYLCQMHNCYNRKWGYVFWDQKRLTEMGLREEMRREYAPFVD
ncbi:hypothetical protein EMCG_08109 [[Emmonsia] crescens]|uniref:F-box domain-containing protein n=1 Tax=[Emmonsia] crescens TaxID=73230 RepID=A0A0G2I6P4_9EURO|nr:hypothetical protein EMCG_08109 [Emmonsia crescens UAMH 3008]